MAISLQPNVWHVKNSEGDYLSSAILSTTLPQEADAILQRVRSALNTEEINANTFKEGFSDDLDNLVSDARGTLDQMLEEQEQLISDIRSTAQAKTDAQSAAAAAAQSATAASGSATAAAGSASNASDSANAAGQSASAASQSATAASNSATAASGSATAASNSATAAAGSASDARTVLNSVVAETQDILDSIPSDYSDLSDDVDQLKIDIVKKANAAELKSATPGDIVTFESGAEGLGIKKLVASIEPVQDLHGYDHPWPAGGNVNKFGDYTVVNGYITSDGVIAAASGNKTYIVPIEAGTAYGLKIVRTSLTGGAADDDVQVAEYSSENRPVVGETVGTRIAAWGYVDNLFRYAFTTGANTKWLAIKIGNEQKTDVEATAATVQLEKGSSVPTTPYTPYSNICPISGWTGAEISGTGKNLNNTDPRGGYINLDKIQGYRATQDGFYLLCFPCKPNTTYTVSFTKSLSRLTTGYINEEPATGVDVFSVNTSLSQARTITTGANAKYIVAYYWNTNADTGDAPEVQVELGSTATDFVPYTGNKISVSFPSSAGDSGTVYGGTLTLNPDRTGTLVVDRAIFDLGTILNWNKSSGVFYDNIASDAKYVKDSKAICSCYKTAPASRTWSTLSNGEFIIWPGLVGDPRVAIAIRDDSCSTSDELRATVNGETVTYLLATPQTYQLTAEQISGILTTLYGTNNIWADTGSITELDYLVDTQYVIGKLNNAINTKAPVILETASGVIASFSDGADSMPVKKLVAKIEPVQDLHGYDSPWPGGGGVNKWDFLHPASVQNATVTENSDGTFVAAGSTASAFLRYLVPVTANKRHILFCSKSNAIGNTAVLGLVNVFDGSDSSAAPLLTNALIADSAKAITPTGDYIFIVFTVTGGTGSGSATVSQPFIIAADEGIPVYSPYSNICPISGWTGANVQRTGKNLFGLDGFAAIGKNQCTATVQDNVITMTKTGVDPYISRYPSSNNTTYTEVYGCLNPCKPGVTYKLIPSDSRISKNYVVFWDESLTIAYRTPIGLNEFTAPLNARYMTFRLGNGSNTDIAIGESVSFTIMCCLASETDTTFEPCSCTTIPVTFPSEAETVYGGTLTINPDRTGTLVVNRASADLGAMTWSNNGDYWYNLSLVSVMKVNGYSEYSPIISEKYETSYPSRIISKVKTNIIANYTAALGGVMVYTGDNTTAPSGQLVYELASPQTYQLTAEQISGILTTLYGQNNIWADTGDVTVEYPADTKLYIEKLTQPTEDDMTADHAISAGTFFQLGNTLYFATTAIAAGATIIPGTNATKLSLADALNQLNT